MAKRVEIRLYKRYDADLIAICDTGINLLGYLPDVLKGYVSGNPVKLYVPFCKPHDLNDAQIIHKAIYISDKDSLAFLKQIKHGRGNAFYKALLREALVRQSFGVYFSDNTMIQKEDAYVKSIDISSIPNLIICEPEKEGLTHHEKVLGKGTQKEYKKEKKTNEPSQKVSENSSEATVIKHISTVPSVHDNQEEMRDMQEVSNTDALAETNIDTDEPAINTDAISKTYSIFRSMVDD